MGLFGVFKKQICGLNVTGPQGVNAKNEFIIGQIGGDGSTPLTAEYWYQPAIRLGDKVITPVGNVTMFNNDEDFVADITIPEPPQDAWEDGQNYILGLDDNAEVAWIKFPNLPEDFDEKNYVLALDDEGVMIWKAADSMAVRYIPVTFKGFTSDADKDYTVSINDGEILLNNSHNFDGDIVTQCTIMLKAGDEIDISIVGADAHVSNAQIEYTTSTGEMVSDDSADTLILDGLVIGETWMSLVIDLTIDK